jgi:flagellin
MQANSNFQSKTIQRLSSGFRINTAGDDPAGLCVANRYRQDTALVTQGVRNVNNGISTLQIIDGGMSNISQILDRLKVLATQSASGSFTGDRTVLNAEFQTLLGEVNRQSQSIGLNQGGPYANPMSVYLGGVGSTVTVDLSASAVDSRSLGLGIPGAQSMMVTGQVNLGGTSTTTSVAQILAANTTPTPGYTTFYFTGPGFSDANKVAVAVNLQGVSGMNSLVAAINAAIPLAANGSGSGAAAFKSSGIIASVSTDTSGGQELSFGSNTMPFQVEAGDLVSNGLLGNLVPATGAAIGTTVLSAKSLPLATTVAGQTPAAGVTGGSVVVQITGAGLSAPVKLTLAPGATTAVIPSAVSSNAQLVNAGISASVAADGTVTFTDSHGEDFSIRATGDTGNILGLGTFISDGTSAADYTTISGAYNPSASGKAQLEFSINGAASITIPPIQLTGQAGSAIADALNADFLANPALQVAGLTASYSGGTLTISSVNHTYFRLNPAGSAPAADLGFGTAGQPFTFTQSAGTALDLPADSGGASNVAPLAFSPMIYGSDSQSLTISAIDSSGALETQVITLANNSQGRQGQDIDQAIAYINAHLANGGAAMQQVVAVKENVGGAERINFLSALPSFTVDVGASASGNGMNGGVAVAENSSVLGGSRNLAIDTQSGAEQAVVTVAAAVGKLGTAQGVVGQGQNQLTYALNLAQSQISNFSAAESQIRDTDVAAEAANLTKSQVLAQAGIAAMTQANTSAQAVLTLLKG